MRREKSEKVSAAKWGRLLALIALPVLLGIAVGWLATGAEAQGPARRGEARQLPQPDPAFTGTVGRTVSQSKADYPLPLKVAQGSPNVLLILLDDVGFGMCSPFGGPVPTPHLDQLAANGLRFTRFHTTALCSPTRAALLTGRNHHSVATGVITECATGFPGYTGIIPRSTAMVSQVLRDNGYATSMFGKWHNTPEMDIGPAGPFDRWPTGFGFDYFYGFNQGEAHQYYPTLYRNTVPVPPPKSPEQGYHLTVDMTDEAIHWIRNVRAAGDRPWFSYFSTGAVHAPHHAPAEWREKYRGKFSHGWDRQRELTHARQVEMGIVPQGTLLTPRPTEIPAWESQSAEARQVSERLMENYAAYMAHTDDQVGRLIDSLRESGELDNTLLLYVVGDNGASAEGGLQGTFSEIASLLGLQLGLKSLSNRLDEIGGPTSEPHVPVGWAWAMNAPFQWSKQVASHFGGTRNPLVVHWPDGIKSRGELRTQFHHVIDIVPTILDVCGVSEPSVVNGIPQKPIEGVSLRYCFDEPGATGQRTTQYFEMFANRAIYHEGWVACSRYGLPWETAGRGSDFDKAPSELYHVDRDFSQAVNLAEKQPEKLRELQALFEAEAARYDVFPLDARMAERFDPRLRLAGKPKVEWTYYGNAVWLPEAVGPLVFPRHHTLTADLSIPTEGAEGVVACCGSFSAGWSLYVADGKPVFRYTLFEVADATITGTRPLPPGDVELGVEFTPSGKPGGGGTLELTIDGEPAGKGILRGSSFRHGLEPFEIGRDSITAVDPAYRERGTFPFSGTIKRVQFRVLP